MGIFNRVYCCIYIFKNTKKSEQDINYTIETISLVVIVISFLIFDDLLLNLFYPNFLVVLFTGIFILFVNKKSYFYNFITTPLFVYIGKASFSIYLLHQPIFAFYRIYKYRDVSFIEELMLIIFSLVLVCHVEIC